MISDAVVRMVKYYPELLPDSWFGQVPLNAEVAPPILDLKNFGPYIIGLSNIQLTANAAVVLRARYTAVRVEENIVRVEENTAAMLSALVNAWRLFSKGALYYNLFGTVGAPVANYTTHYGLWAYKPTIAHKLLYNIKLTSDEQAIANELGIKNTVEKGLLPLPINQQLDREYHIISEETHSRSINIAAANTVYTIEVLYPKPGEFLVLTRMAAAPGGAGDVVRFIVDRDNDVGIANVQTFPLSLVAGGEVACFIPAMTELRLTTSDVTGIGAHLFRYTVQRVRLNNILRVRFGLVTKDEVPGDTWNKVLGGIL